MATQYTVTAVVQSQQIGPDGSLIDSATVTFTIADGAGVGSVEVPLTGDWQDAATAAIQAKADQMAALLAL